MKLLLSSFKNKKMNILIKLMYWKQNKTKNKMKVSEWTDQKCGLKSEMLWHHLNPVFTKDLLTRRFYKHCVIYPNSISISARDKIQMVSEGREVALYTDLVYHRQGTSVWTCTGALHIIIKDENFV